MLLIPCPFCGARDEVEFSYGGPAHRPRPEDPAALGDAAWVDYLTVPENKLDFIEEYWQHSKGCGSWLTIRRHSATHEIDEVRHGR